MQTVKITFSPDHDGEKGPFSKGQIKQKVADAMHRQGIDAYTLIKGVGYWKGIAEQSYTVEVKGVTDALDIDSIKAVSEDLKTAFDQEAVLFSIASEAIEFL